ncbi:hypothetical protein ACTFIW_000848 [Dictyostelium discoideum]
MKVIGTTKEDALKAFTKKLQMNIDRKGRQPKTRRATLLTGYPQKKGFCVRVYETKPKKPNSAIRKVAKVSLKVRNKRRNVIVYIPGFGPHNLQQLSTEKEYQEKIEDQNFQLINAFMQKGKYIKAEKIYFTVLNRLTTLGIVNPYKFVRETVIKMTPIMGVVKKKRGVKEFVYPKYLEPRIGEKFAIQWLVKQIEKQKGADIISSIIEEFLKASKQQGEVIKEKWALYKESNSKKKMVLNWRGVKSRLYSGKRRIDGRNKGVIAIRARGGALKRKYRYIEHYKQKWIDKWLFIMRIEYDPNRSAHIALCSILKEGIYFYVISVAKLEVGSLIITSNIKHGILQIGYTTKLKNIPEGILINNIELLENSGSKISRAAGTSSLIIKQYNKKYSLVKLSSKRIESRKRGIRPIVRGLVMNPVDHPHGGRTKGGMHWKSFSGKLAYNISSRTKELQNYEVVATPTIVTKERSSVIIPYYLTKTIYVYNGRKYVGVKITEKSLGEN